MITLAQLSEIECGCDGVTPGPWALEPFDDLSAELTAPCAESANGKRYIGAMFFQPDSKHIARLDPATVRELVRLARIGLEADTGGIEFSEFHGDSQLLWR